MVYYEMVYVLQYVQVGWDWWIDYVMYIMMWVGFGQFLFYGDGMDFGVGCVELVEGMVEFVELYLVDLKYGLLYSDGLVNVN